MAKQSSYFTLGLWVIIVFALFFAALIFIGGGQWGRAYVAYTVRYPVTFALPDEIKPGASIFCGGAEVGRVTDIELRRETGDANGPALAAWLDIEVEQIVELRSTCKIVARGPLLGGGGKLVITDPGRDGSVLQAGDRIDGTPTGSFEGALDLLNAELDPANQAGLLATVKSQFDPADLNSILGKLHLSLDDLNRTTAYVALHLNAGERGALINKVSRVLDNVNETTAALRDQVVAQGGKGSNLLAKVHAALDSLNKGLAQAADMLRETRPVVHETLLAVQRTTDTVEHGIAQPIAQELNRQNVGSLLAALHVSFDKINHSLGDLEDVSGRGRTMVALNEGRFNRLMQDVSETAIHLKSASKDLRRNPWRLFYRPSLEETKQLNIFDAAREFSEAAARLDDSTMRLGALVETYDGNVPADAPGLAEILDRLRQTFEDYTRAEEALWAQLDVK